MEGDARGGQGRVGTDDGGRLTMMMNDCDDISSIPKRCLVLACRHFFGTTPSSFLSRCHSKYDHSRSTNNMSSSSVFVLVHITVSRSRRRHHRRPRPRRGGWTTPPRVVPWLAPPFSSLPSPAPRASSPNPLDLNSASRAETVSRLGGGRPTDCPTKSAC